MEKAWRAGRFDAPEMDEYVEVVTDIIRHTPSHVLYHKVFAAARRSTLLSPLWCENRWRAMTEIGRALDKLGPQGSLCHDPFVYQLPSCQQNI